MASAKSPKPIAIVLAAGDGTRMLSQIPKVLHALYGKPLITHVLDAIRGAGIPRVIAVIGYRSQLVRRQLGPGVEIVIQRRLKGTAHAVLQVRARLARFTGEVVVFYGDTPLLTSQTVCGLLDAHRRAHAACTVLTAVLKEPTGYGRIVRDDTGRIVRIVEDADATPLEKGIEEINVGGYCFTARPLFQVLRHVTPAPNGEYYLTDAVAALVKQGATVASASTRSVGEFLGINSRADLARVQTVMRTRILEQFMLTGVTIVDPYTTYIYHGASIGQDTVVFPNTVIEDRVRIGRGCQIGPFCRLGPGTRVGDHVRVGSFVDAQDVEIGSAAVIGSGTVLAGPLTVKAGARVPGQVPGTSGQVPGTILDKVPGTWKRGTWKRRARHADAGW